MVVNKGSPTKCVQWKPLKTKIEGLMKSVHAIRISCYQNFMLSEQLGILKALKGPFSLSC